MLNWYNENILIIFAGKFRFMPRKVRPRKVVEPPSFKGFKPYGVQSLNEVPTKLLYEEYEAIKLADYDLLDHKTAADIMGISRPTFARIYEEARRKIAKSLVEVREIKAVYGNAMFDKNWFLCDDCQARFTIPEKTGKHRCALCKSANIHEITN